MNDARKTRAQLRAELRALRDALARDVTEMAETREALDRSEARYRALAENASDLILELDEQGAMLFVSPNSESILGFPPDPILKGEVDLEARVHASDRERAEEVFHRTALPGQEWRSEYRIRHGGGDWRWLETAVRSYRTASGALHRAVIARDVTRRVQTQLELEESQERYRVLTEATGDLVTETDGEARLLYVSPSCKRITGYDPQDLKGTTPFLLVHPDDAERRIEDDFEGGKTAEPSISRPYRVLHRDGTWRWVETTRTAYRRADGELSVLRVTRDITLRVEAEAERRRIEERMQQAQKLEGLGVMAGGIAHDFNNLLTPILGDTSLSLLDLPPNSPLRARLQRVQKAVHRAAALTNQMLAYAGEATLHMQLVNLSHLVEEIGQLLETAASRDAKLSYELARNLPMIEADPARISQVLMNLITNASEAVGRGGVVLRTGQARMTDAGLAGLYLGSELPEGEYAFLEVSDRGPGMDEATRARIFDPFFTTKFKGRGLGLAAVLGIVRAHRGAIDLESAVGRGTRFRVLFPASHGRFPRRPPGRRSIEGTAPDPPGREDRAGERLRRGAGVRALRGAATRRIPEEALPPGGPAREDPRGDGGVAG